MMRLIGLIFYMCCVCEGKLVVDTLDAKEVTVELIEEKATLLETTEQDTDCEGITVGTMI